MVTEIEQLKAELVKAREAQRVAEERAVLAETRTAHEQKAREAAEELTKNPKKALVLSEMNAMKRKKKEKGQKKC